jgi:asparagine synthase (glutamine-hydrolysing)
MPAPAATGEQSKMSILAGIFYFDRRPISAADEARVRRALGDFDRQPVHCFRSPGLIMGVAGSPAGSSEDNDFSRSPDGSVCTWDGRLDNQEDLRLELSCDFPRPSTNSDLAIKAYRSKGAAGFRGLVGDWSLAIWDGRLRSVVLASDYAGVRPLYYYRGADRLLWSSCLSELIRWTGINELDEVYVADFLTHATAAHRTPYRGVYPVPPGYAVCVSPDRMTTQAFWDLPVDEETRLQDDQCYEEQLRTLFRQAVSVRLRSHGPVCAELSGGLDSSSIVCMATQLKHADSHGSPELITLSYTHAGSTDERYFRAVERACNLSGIHLQLEKLPFVAPSQPGGAAPAWWEPRFRELARLMESLGSSVFLTGQLGDFIMGNVVDDSDQVADYLRQHRFLQAAREAFSWSQSLRVPIYSILWRALRTNYSDWAAPIVAATMCDRYKHIDSLAPEFRKRVALSDYNRQSELHWQAASPGRRGRFRTLSEMLSGRLLQAPEALQHVSYTHPFAHRPLVEFMLTIPPAVVCRPGEPRRLMRRAFAGLLPPAILKRRSKGTYERVYRQALVPMAAELLKRPGDIRMVEFGYVDRGSVTERLTRFTEGLDCNESQLRQLILFEFWLRNSKNSGAGQVDDASLSWVN